MHRREGGVWIRMLLACAWSLKSHPRMRSSKKSVSKEDRELCPFLQQPCEIVNIKADKTEAEELNDLA